MPLARTTSSSSKLSILINNPAINQDKLSFFGVDRWL